VQERLPKEKRLIIDLLRATEESIFSKNPDELEARVNALPAAVQHVIIDEIQKSPKLLDVVDRLIEKTNKQFILTGSSVRKLKAGSANLLAGRAFERQLHPFTASNLQSQFDLDAVLYWGSLPAIFQFDEDDERKDFLLAYTNTYQFFFYHTLNSQEVDLVVHRIGQPPAFIEIKSSDQIEEKEIRHLQRIQKDFPRFPFYCLPRDPNTKIFDEILSLPWQRGLEEFFG
jgi:predicted AAA+ superfamily ATPase